MSIKKGSERKRPSGKRLKPEIISKGFALYCKGESVSGIARQLQISRATVSRYRDEDNWERRKAENLKEAERRVDAQIVTDQARQVNLARLMQAKGMGRFRTLNDSDISARDAISMVKEGILLERTILGEGEKTVNISITLPNDLEDL